MKLTNKQYFRVSAVALLLLMVTASINAANDDRFKNVVIKTTEVNQGIYMLEGQGGNIGVSVGESGVVLIDDQFAALTDKIKAAVSKLSDKPIKFVLNTHWHFDHTGGNEVFGKENVLIVAHDNVHQRMSVENYNEALGMTVPASPKEALPVLTFNDRVTLRINGEVVNILYIGNAHTDGDSIVQFTGSNVVHTGDIWSNGVYPLIDTSTGGTIDGMIQAVEKILVLIDDDTRIIPGHGPVGNKKELQDYSVMLKTVRSRMQRLIDEGKTLDEITALKPNADYDKTWGAGFINSEIFTRTVYDSLTQ